MTKDAKKVQDSPATHQPTKAQMDEAIVIDGSHDEIAAAVLRGGASRRGPAESESTEQR